MGHCHAKEFSVVKKRQISVTINLNARVSFEKQIPTGIIPSPFMEFDTIWKSEHQHGEAVFLSISIPRHQRKTGHGFLYRGRASLVCGTHTHVAIRRLLQILPNGTGYVSDVGMTGR